MSFRARLTLAAALAVALAIAYECAVRLSSPVVIHYGDAVAIATLGLGVNIVSALLLRDENHHHHPAGQNAHGQVRDAHQVDLLTWNIA